MSTSVLGEGEKLITTVLLNGERLHVKVHANAVTREVFDQVTRYIGVNEVQYFGLMIIKDGEHQFLDLEEKLSKLAKYAPHLWKDDSSWNSSLVFTLFFRVKYYVENICLLEEQATRHQYYLQLRKDVLENNIRIHDDTAMVLASYALQAELGDYDKSSFGTDYFVPQHYLPAKTIAKLTVPYIKSALPAMHQSHRGLTEAQASIEFLKEAQKLSEYGILFYRVFKKEYNRKVPYTLGVCVRGLIIYEDTGTVRNPFCKHPWTKIKKMSFKRRKFLIHADCPNPVQGHIVLYTANYKRSRYLLKTCSSFYNFQMHMADKMAKFQDYFEPPRISSTIPTVRIDPDGMPDVADGRRTFSEREPERKRASSMKDQSKELSKQKPKPQAKQYTVDLVKVDNSFGFSIVGGIELGGIFVKELTIGGPAASSGQISAGDRIVQVNKVNFENVTRREAINTLRNATDRSKFTFETFGQTMLLEADPSILTPLTLSASSIATLGNNNVPPLGAERESELVRVELPKKDGNFGIGFTGGPELGGIYIKSFLPGGSAEANGRIAIGDRLVEIGNTNVETFTRKQVQDMLRTSSNVVTLVLERYKKIPMNDVMHYIDPERVLASNQSYFSVSLVKKNESLGFSITGGHELGGIFIKSLNMNGPAAMDRRLEVGDRIVAINNISLETATRPKALEVIRTAASPVRLIIEKCMPPENRDPSSMPMDEETMIRRSDSIKSLPTGYSKNDNSRLPVKFRGLALSVQDIPGVSLKTSTMLPYDFDRTDGRQQMAPQQQQQMLLHQQQQQQQQQQQPFPPQQNDGGQMYNQQDGGNYGNEGTNVIRKSMLPEVFVVDLPKVNGSFGLGLTGGPEVAGIFVKALQPGGAADRDGRIVKGDRLVEINGRRMDGYSKNDAIEMLKSSVGMATLIFERYGYQLQPRQFSSQLSSFDGDCVPIELQKKRGSFGLCLTGGPEMGGIYVKSVLPAGASDGKIAKGDRIVEISGIAMDGFLKFQCDEILKKAPNTITIMVERFKIADEIPLLDGDLFSVELRRVELGLGLTLTGGIEKGGIYVKGILPESPAEHCEKIRRGDRIVEINGVSVDGLTKHQAADLFKRANVINILFERNATYDNIIVPESDFFSVDLAKKNNSFGITLAGGPEIGGVFIKSLQTGGAAADDARLQKGDRILAINGQIIDGMTRQQAYEILKGSLNKVILYLERCTVGSDVPPLDTVLTVVELTKAAGSFGLSLMGGPESGGIFVRAMMPNGSAEIDGRVQIGDKITEINGISLDACTKIQAIEILKNCPQTSTFILERYRTSPRRLNGTRQGSMSSSFSQQSLSQSRTSIHSLGSESNQSYHTTQIPSYCTLPRQTIGQSAGASAFHPVAKSAPNTPKVERAMSGVPASMHAGQISRNDLEAARMQGPRSQITSTMGSTVTQAVSSIYSTRNEIPNSQDQQVKALTSSGPTITSSGSLTRLSSLQRGSDVPVVPHNGIRTAPTTPAKQSGLQWLPLGGEAGKRDRVDGPSSGQVKPLDNKIPGASIPYNTTSSSGTGRTGLVNVTSARVSETSKAQSVYLTGQNVSSTLSNTLPRGFGASKDLVGSSYGSTPSVYAPKSNTLSSSTVSLFSSLTNRPPNSKPQPAPRTSSLRDINSLGFSKGPLGHTSSLDKPETSIYSHSTSSESKSILSSVYSVSKTQTASVTSIKSNDFASLHSSIYAATQQRSALGAVMSSLSSQSSTDVESRSVYEPKRVVGQNIYSLDKVKGQSSFDSSLGQGLSDISSEDSEQSTFVADSHNAILQSARSVIGIGHNPQGINNILSSVSTNQSQASTASAKVLGSLYGNTPRTASHSSAPYVNTGDVTAKPVMSSAPNQGLLKTSQPEQHQTNIVDTLTNPFARQYPRPSMQAMASDINENDVTTKTTHQNGEIYQNSGKPAVVRRGSSGFHGLGDHVFEVVLYKGPVGLGMNLTGGANEGPIRVKRIAKGSAADECGQLQVGDIILEVNGVSVEKLSSREVVGLLRSSPNEILLLVKREMSFNRQNYQQANPYVGL
ncbi:tyrosine-protein phosphatase non-receptor type 13-like isoform X2 [Rhopilema esculentum]|uniref:tyrosine-protein phosphatase non-receptor type 13-like isoform X2 n=1 Tax=Rhopilema esculentum TaxID=499914 RepID=UPI0031CFB653